MDIETIEAVARQKIKLASVRPTENRAAGPGYLVEFSSNVSVSTVEANRFIAEASEHFHDVQKCTGCCEAYNRGKEIGVEQGAMLERKTSRITLKQIEDLLSVELAHHLSSSSSRGEFAKWMYSQLYKDA